MFWILTKFQQKHILCCYSANVRNVAHQTKMVTTKGHCTVTMLTKQRTAVHKYNLSELLAFDLYL